MSFLLHVSGVLNYAGEDSRKFIEGENIVNSNHLMYCKTQDTQLVLLITFFFKFHSYTLYIPYSFHMLLFIISYILSD